MRKSVTVLALVLVAATGRVEALCGDCNLSGGVDIVDALFGAQHAVGLITLAGPAFANCDVNASASVTVVDALIIAQASSGLFADPCMPGGGGGPLGTCGDPILLTVAVPYNGSTVSATDTQTTSCGSLFAFANDQVHEINLAGASFTINVTLNATFSASVEVRSGTCMGASIGCDASVPLSLSLPGRSAGTYFIIVDGDAAGMSGRGTYTLTVTTN